MAIALRGAAVVPAGNPTTGFTVVIPAGVLANDLLFLVLESRDHTSGTARPTVTDNDTGGNAWAIMTGAESTDRKFAVWWKRATSATASKTITVAGCVGSSSGVLKAFSGASTGATPFSNVSAEANASANETHAGFTPSNADSMLCGAVGNHANDNAVTSLAFATAGALNVTGAEKLSTGGSDCAAIFGHVLQAGGPTATGNMTWAQTDGTTNSIVWAIVPQVLNNYTLAADPGVYTVTGSAAGVRAARKIAAAPGVYAVTGSAAGLRATRRMTAEPGVYQVTGSPAAMRKGFTMLAAPGVYAVTGSPAGLRAARVLQAAPGVYAVTGSVAGLGKGFRMLAEPGLYSVTGSPAAVLAQRKIAAAPGVYSVTGSPVTFSKGFRMLAEPGVYVVTGQGLTIRRALIFRVDPGSYQVTGYDADVYQGTPPPATVPGGGTRRGRRKWPTLAPPAVQAPFPLEIAERVLQDLVRVTPPGAPAPTIRVLAVEDLSPEERAELEALGLL